MTEMKVSSYICGITHKIMGRVEGDRIIIEIDTPCEKFRDLSHLEFPLQEMYDTQEKLSLEMARKAVTDIIEQYDYKIQVFDTYQDKPSEILVI